MPIFLVVHEDGLPPKFASFCMQYRRRGWREHDDQVSELMLQQRIIDKLGTMTAMLQKWW